MKTNVIKTMAIIATLMFCGLPQNAVSQENKVKKVKYLGHKYEGQVNKDKVPEGDGTMNIGGLIIKGKFEGATVKDAEVVKGYETVMKTAFTGVAKFDETDNITLVKGGKLSCRYFVGEGDNYYRWNPKWNTLELKEDKIVNNQNFDPEEIIVTDFLDYSKDIKSCLNPPVAKKERVLRPSMIRWLTSTQTWQEDLGFKDNQEKVQLSPLNGYKDDQGRIWDWSEVGNDLNTHRIKWRVTYPNGSFYNYSYYRGTVDRDWVINYPDGKKLKYDSNGYTLDGAVYLDAYEPYGYEKTFAKLVSLNSLPKGHLGEGSKRVNVIVGDLSSAEIGERIEKALSLLVDNPEIAEENVFSIDKHDIWGKVINGKYITKENVDANRAAANAKAEKELQAKIAPFTKRFGFNPVGKTYKQLLTVGRSLNLIRDWEKFIVNNEIDHFLHYLRFNLSIDHGSSKCYDIIRVDDDRYTKNIGYIWVSGDKITSVVWY